MFETVATDIWLALSLHLSQSSTEGGAHLAGLLSALGYPERALTCFDYATQRASVHPSWWMGRAEAERATGNLDRALTSLLRLADAAPDRSDVAANIGLILRELDRVPQAIGWLEKAIAMDPGAVEARMTLGHALLELNRLSEALSTFQEVLALSPARNGTHAAIATALNRLHRLAEAVHHLHLAQAEAPDDIGLLWNESLACLALGDYRRGWRLFEYRPTTPWPGDDRKHPLWLGQENIAGKTLLCHGEMGFGDVIQFCRYLPLLADKQVRVICQVPPELARLASTLRGIAAVIPDTEQPPDFDFHCPVMSLPLAFGTNLSTIPAEIPYLHADAVAVERWQQRFTQLSGLKVGIAWAGGRRPDDPTAVLTDRIRSTSLDHMAPFFQVPGVTFVSLQKGPPADDARQTGQLGPVVDWTDELRDFADTAALIQALDLIISVDTSVVHVAGALAKPVWILNRFGGCWRWLGDRVDSPWYPTVRLFTQTTPGDWDSAINPAAAALRELAAARAG
jgi:Flp pilus assembly protein TadD